MTTATCNAVVDRGLIERYLAKPVSDLEIEEIEDFEAHFVTCSQCQTELRLAVAVRAELKSTVASRRRWTTVGVGTAVAIAAGIGAMMVVPSRPDAALVNLGHVAMPPVYLGVPVRAQASIADSLFAAGMTAYTAGRFDVAADELSSALAHGVDRAPAEFFRAVSLLMTNRPREAAGVFAAVIALGDTPYGGEARYYRAKALLRVGAADEALRELRAAAGSPLPIAADARALSDSVEALSRR